jgi:O-antigen/teichoic acid export membrane protein
LAAEDPEAFSRLYRQAQRLLLILGLPAAVGLWAVRHQAALLVYGPEFGETARAFAWLAPVLAFLFVNFLQLGALTALGRQSRCAVATGACVAVNVGLNLWLIPLHGFVGAAAATLVTEAVLFLLCAAFIRRALGPSGLAERAWRPAAAAGAMGLALWALPAWPLAALLPLGAALYAGLLLAAGGLSPAEVRELWALVRRPGLYAREGGGG